MLLFLSLILFKILSKSQPTYLNLTALLKGNKDSY